MTRKKTWSFGVKKRGYGVGMWIISFLLCMNVAPPLYAAKKKKALPKTKITAQKKVRPTVLPRKKPTSKPSKVAATKKVKKVVGKKPKSKIVRFKGKNLPRFGRFFVGRVIGPRWKDKVVRCPYCTKKIRVRRLQKKWRPRRYDSDLRPFYGHYQQKHRVWFCHHCSYAAYAKDFYHSYNKVRMKQAITPMHKRLQRKLYPPVMNRFHAAAAAYWARKKNSRFFGKLFLRAVWSAREERELKEIPLFRQRAIAAMTMALRRNEYKKKELPSTYYTLAELFRQEGKFPQALKWLEKAMHSLEAMKKKKVKGVLFGKELEGWMVQVQTQIVKKNVKVFVLQ